VDDRDESNRRIMIDCHAASAVRRKGNVQIVILPKKLPSGVTAPINPEFNGHPDLFFVS
jgi:hypothetical protein